MLSSGKVGSEDTRPGTFRERSCSCGCGAASGRGAAQGTWVRKEATLEPCVVPEDGIKAELFKWSFKESTKTVVGKFWAQGGCLTRETGRW